MGPDEAAMLGAGLLFAGHETTVIAIDGGVLRLLTNPDQHAALAADPDRLDPAVEEILRSALPTRRDNDEQRTGLLRYAREDVEFDGVRIAAGDLVLLGLRTANHDTVPLPRPGAARHHPHAQPASNFRVRPAVGCGHLDWPR
jgi:cytochrome P450